MNKPQTQQASSAKTGRLALDIARQRGLTLIELMISIVIGLVLVGGVLSIFVSTTQTAKLNDNLMRVQENARGAFDVMARDIRETGQNPCGSKKVTNILRVGSAIPVWTDWNLGTLRGYDNLEDETAIEAFGTANTDRVSGTDAVLVIRTGQDDYTVDSHDTSLKRFVLSASSKFKENDIAFVCDALSSAIFQIYAASPTSGVNRYKNIDHQTDAGNMNCGDLLSHALPVTNCPNTVKKFDRTQSQTPEVKIAQLSSSFWYVGYADNIQKRRSLYRSTITRSGSGGTTIIMKTDEVIPDVQDLQITYLTRDGSTGLASNWVDATAVTDWTDYSATTQVVAVKLDLTLQTTDNVSATQTPIQRHLIHVVGLRNRAQ